MLEGHGWCNSESTVLGNGCDSETKIGPSVMLCAPRAEDTVKTQVGTGGNSTGRLQLGQLCRDQIAVESWHHGAGPVTWQIHACWLWEELVTELKVFTWGLEGQCSGGMSTRWHRGDSRGWALAFLASRIRPSGQVSGKAWTSHSPGADQIPHQGAGICPQLPVLLPTSRKG